MSRNRYGRDDRDYYGEGSRAGDRDYGSDDAYRSRGGGGGSGGHAKGAGLFVTWTQLRLLLSVLLPTAFYVAAIPFAGLYLSSAALVVWFMVRLGGFPLWMAAAAGLATALVAFVVFELWFLVALPKGPVETWLGY